MKRDRRKAHTSKGHNRKILTDANGGQGWGVIRKLGAGANSYCRMTIMGSANDLRGTSAKRIARQAEGVSGFVYERGTFIGLSNTSIVGNIFRFLRRRPTRLSTHSRIFLRRILGTSSRPASHRNASPVVFHCPDRQSPHHRHDYKIDTCNVA
jgi:hypothetical protein